jgi:hypothetical protein
MLLAAADWAGFWATAVPVETAAMVNNREDKALIRLAWGLLYCTVSCTVVECESVPLVPVIVSV